MSNLSTLERNMLFGLSETAGVLYLKLIDVFRDEKKAFLAADRYDREVGGVLDYILRKMGPAMDERTLTDLSRFFAERWRHNFMGAKTDG